MVLPGRMAIYRGRVEGKHLEIRSLSWRSERSKRILTAGPISGEIKYGSSSDEISGSVAGVKMPVVILEGPASFINGILTR